MKKISTWLYFLLSALLYYGMIMLNTFVIKSFDLPYKIITAIAFAVMIYFNFAFFQTHYDEISSYTISKKIIIMALSFAYVATVSFIVRFKLMSQINMIILIHSCTLAFPMLITMISVLISQKARVLSRIVYYFGIVELFAGGLAAIISLFLPNLFMKG